MSKVNPLFILIIILATLLSYANSLHNQFIWDDEDWILKNSTVKDWHKWPALFVQNSIHGARKGSNFYRPLQAISHGVDYLLWKYNLPGHHVTNVILHIMTSIILFLLLGGIFSQRIAFLSALFFAIHPVQTEAITYISGRADPMSALFILLAIFLFKKSLFLSSISFIFALLSKESALITPALIVLYILFKGKDVKKEVKRIWPFVIIIIIYGVLRMSVLDFSQTIPENAPKPFLYVPFFIRLCTFLKTLPEYIRILIWPFGLHMERDVSLSYSLFEPQAALGVFMAIALFIAGFAVRKKERFLLFSAAWFFIAIFPNSNIFPVNALIYEHWLYLPSVGFFVIMAWLLERLFKNAKALKTVSALLVLFITVFYIWRTIERNREWHDPMSFYEATIKYKPDSMRLHNNLAMAYADEGRKEDAIREYRKAIELGDYYPQPHYNLSNIYLESGDYRAAIRELKRSLEIDKNFLYSHERLAVIYFNMNRLSEAGKEATFLLEKEPENRIALEVLAGISKKRVPDNRPQDIQ